MVLQSLGCAVLRWISISGGLKYFTCNALDQALFSTDLAIFSCFCKALLSTKDLTRATRTHYEDTSTSLYLPCRRDEKTDIGRAGLNYLPGLT